jgi:hypothetical protein
MDVLLLLIGKLVIVGAYAALKLAQRLVELLDVVGFAFFAGVLVSD